MSAKRKRQTASPIPDFKSDTLVKQGVSPPTALYGMVTVVEPWIRLVDPFGGLVELERLVCHYVGSGHTASSLLHDRLAYLRLCLELEWDRLTDGQESAPLKPQDECFVGRRLELSESADREERTISRETCAKPDHDLACGLSSWSYQAIIDASLIFLPDPRKFFPDPRKFFIDGCYLRSYDESTGVLRIGIRVLSW